MVVRFKNKFKMEKNCKERKCITRNIDSILNYTMATKNLKNAD